MEPWEVYFALQQNSWLFNCLHLSHLLPLSSATVTVAHQGSPIQTPSPRLIIWRQVFSYFILSSHLENCREWRPQCNHFPSPEPPHALVSFCTPCVGSYPVALLTPLDTQHSQCPQPLPPHCWSIQLSTIGADHQPPSADPTKTTWPPLPPFCQPPYLCGRVKVFSFLFLSPSHHCTDPVGYAAQLLPSTTTTPQLNQPVWRYWPSATSADSIVTNGCLHMGSVQNHHPLL